MNVVMMKDARSSVMCNLKHRNKFLTTLDIAIGTTKLTEPPNIKNSTQN